MNTAFPDRSRTTATDAGAARSQLVRFILVGLILVSVALAGGSARADALPLLILRPVLILATAAILLIPGKVDWGSVRVPMILLGAFAATIAIQLVPLPPSLWSQLPGRDHLDAALVLATAPGSWLPISLAPDRTWNSLLALMPAFAVLIGCAALNREWRYTLVLVVLGIGVSSALLGLLQILAGAETPLYYYRYMHRGLPTGFLANRNHAAALFALMLPLLRVWTAMPAPSRQVVQLRAIVAVSLGALFIALILVTGSRSGLVLMVIGVLAAALAQPVFRRSQSGRFNRIVPFVLVAAFVAMIVLVILVGRAESIDRLMGVDIDQSEARVNQMPTLLALVREFVMVGTGFGAFDPVFRGYEADDALRFTYFNNAHNDLIELAITGGVLALLVLGLFLIWWVMRTIAAIRSSNASSNVALQQYGSVGASMLLIASLSDYPLRTPLLGAIFALCCVWLAQAGTAHVASGASSLLQPTDGEANDGAGRKRHAQELRYSAT